MTRMDTLVTALAAAVGREAVLCLVGFGVTAVVDVPLDTALDRVPAPAPRRAGDGSTAGGRGRTTRAARVRMPAVALVAA